MVTVKAHGGPIDIQGISIATVDDQARIQRVETWFDPMEMFRQIAPDGFVTKEKIITQLDGSSEAPPVSKNESSQSGGQEEAAKENENESENENHQQVTTVIIETPHPAAVEEALDETNNPKSVEEKGVGSTTEKVNSAVETVFTVAANLVQQSSTTDQINPPNKDEQFSTEPSSSLQSEQKDIIAIAATNTTELAELPATEEPPNQKVDEDDNLATKSVPESSQPPTPKIQSKTEILVGQPSESGARIITPSNDANDKITRAAELIPYLDYNKDHRQQQQQQDVDRSSGQTPSPPTISILSEREREGETKQEPEQPSFVKIIPSALEERLRKLEARLVRLEFMERQHFVVVDSSSSIRSEIGRNGKNGTGTGAGMILGNNANANAGAGADVSTTLLASEVKKKEEGEEEEEDRIKKEEEEDRIIQVVKKTRTDDAQNDDVAKEEEKEKGKEKSMTATKVIGNESSPSAAAVAGGAGCPFLNRG